MSEEIIKRKKFLAPARKLKKILPLKIVRTSFNMMYSDTLVYEIKQNTSCFGFRAVLPEIDAGRCMRTRLLRHAGDTDLWHTCSRSSAN